MRDDSTPAGTGVEASCPDENQLVAGGLGLADPGRLPAEDLPATRQAVARAWLAEAHDEAQSLIRDATDQAMLVANAAEQAAESVLAEARADAEQERVQAELTATAFRAQAGQILLGAQREAEQRHAELAADLTRSWNEHERERRELLALAQAEAADVRTAADQHAATVLARARQLAETTVAQAEESAAGHRDRAERRLAEAEAGARAVREQVAEQVAQSHRELYEARRAAKAEAGLLISDARAEADDLRARTHQLLAEARAEVALLTERREAIAAELGRLSGVIEALFDPVQADADHSVVLEGPPVQSWLITHDSAGQQPAAVRTDSQDHEDVEGTFLLEQLMRAADDPEQQRSVPDGNAWLRTHRGRSAAG